MWEWLLTNFAEFWAYFATAILSIIATKAQKWWADKKAIEKEQEIQKDNLKEYEELIEKGASREERKKLVEAILNGERPSP